MEIKENVKTKDTTCGNKTQEIESDCSVFRPNTTMIKQTHKQTNKQTNKQTKRTAHTYFDSMERIFFNLRPLNV
jgi:hypothetical protein